MSRQDPRAGENPAPTPAKGPGRRLRSWGYVSWLDFFSTWLVGAGLVFFACMLVGYGPHPNTESLLRAAALLAIFVAAFRTELTHMHGATVATQPVLFAMALCLPWHWLPFLVALGVLAGTHGQGYPDGVRVLWLRLGFGFSSLALVTVVALTGVTWNTWTWWTISLAYLAQICLDAAVGLTRAYVQKQPLPLVARGMAMTYLIDAMMGTIGLAIIAMASGRLPGLLLLLVPVILLYLLSQDRQQQFEETVTLESAFSEVNAQARLDPLTGLANRRVWEEAIAAATAPGGLPIGGRTVTILVADLDHLKLANDTFGHEAGDLLLVELAEVLREASPKGATVARIGGDEFGVLVVGEVEERPLDLISVVRPLVAARAAGSDAPVRLSSSFGQASTPPCLSVEDAVIRADQASRVDKATRRVRRQDTGLRAPGMMATPLDAAAASPVGH